MSKNKWKVSLKGARSLSQRCPIVIDTTALVTFNHENSDDFLGTLIALDVNTGEEKWRFDVKHIIGNSVLTADGNIIVTCFNGTVYKIDMNGHIVWQTKPSSNNILSGIILGEHFYYAEIGGGGEYTRALNINNGDIAWEYNNGGHAYALASDGHSRIVHCSVAGSFDDTVVSLHCLDKVTGKALWKTNHSEYLFAPLMVDDIIYIGNRSHIALFDINTGALLLTYAIEENAAVTQQPIKTPHGIVFPIENGHLICLNLLETKKGFFKKASLSLEEVWSCKLSSELEVKLIQHKDQLLAITENGILSKIDHQTGALISETKLTGFKEGYGMTVYDNDLILAVSRDCNRVAGLLDD